jgi:hypothetical protein
MRTEISRMQRRLGTTTVYVTHDQTEAMTLGDRVAVLRRGFLQQVASPRELYEQPVNMFVAGFIGSPPMNFLPAVVSGQRLKLPFLEVDLPAIAADKVTDGQLLIAGIRPEHFEDARVLDESKRAKGATFRAKVDVTEWLGDSQYAYLPFEANAEVTKQLADLAAELDGEALRTQLIISIDAMSRLRENHEGEFWADIRRMHLFDPSTGEVRSDSADGIACWFIDTDYNEESFFVRHAYFLGANDPYKALKTTLKAEINEEAWSTLNSDTSRPFDKPKSGRIAVKVINHLGDEVMKVEPECPRDLLERVFCRSR